MKDTVFHGEVVQRDKDLAGVIVTPANNRQKDFSWFGWSSSTNYNRSSSQDLYDSRRRRGLDPFQLGDKPWYLADLHQYDMEGMFQRGEAAREFEEQFLMVYFSALTIPVGLPEMGILKSSRWANFVLNRLAAKGTSNTVARSRLGHIFRNAIEHVNPSTITSQNRYIRLFESVANNTMNLNTKVLTNHQRSSVGFQGFSQIFRNGKQVWVQTFNGDIINAGVNIIPK